MRKVLVVLAVSALASVVPSAPAAAHSDIPCESSDVFCIRHCNTYHRGLVDRALCLITHNIQS